MKRLIAMALCALLTFSLAACGSSQKQESSREAATTDESVEETASSGGQTDDSVNLYGYSEPVTIKVGYSWGADFEWKGDENSSNNNWVKLYEENNIFPDILYEVDSSQGDTKLSTAIMSGDYPDIIGAKAADYVNYAKSGVIRKHLKPMPLMN